MGARARALNGFLAEPGIQVGNYCDYQFAIAIRAEGIMRNSVILLRLEIDVIIRTPVLYLPSLRIFRFNVTRRVVLLARARALFARLTRYNPH